MKKLLGLLLILGTLLISCSEKPDCEDIVCTMEFRMITVKFVDATGNPQIVKDFTVVNKRTGERMTPVNDMANQGIYVVASDSDILKLSEKGDNVLVSAIDSKTNVKLEVEYLIAGGLCSCHVTKISGPDTVKL
jgi:hypothetical protein